VLLDYIAAGVAGVVGSAGISVAGIAGVVTSAGVCSSDILVPLVHAQYP
jgi:hypothetical protein